MFVKLFPSLLNNRFIKIFNKFVNSKLYIGLMGIFIVLSALFGFEIPIYYITIVIAGVLPALFCSDMTSVIAPALMFYCSFSLKNSDPVLGKSFFDNEFNKINLIIAASIAAFFLLARLIFDLIKKDRRFGYPRLTIGFGLFLISSCISGILSNSFSFNSLLSGAVISFSLFVSYYYFFYSVKWDKKKIDYLFFCLIIYGLALVDQLIGTYFITSDLTHLIGREKVTIGWGIHTSVGGAICLLAPIPFYYICNKKWTLLNCALAILFFIATVAAQARGPIICVCSIDLIAFVITAIKLKSKDRIHFLFVFFAVFAIGFGCARLIINTKMHKFAGLINSVVNFKDLREFSNNRFVLYEAGLKQFTAKPIFGNGWLSCDGPKYTKIFLPSRWHNTFIQTLATGGVVLTLSYLLHRVETVIILFRKNKRLALNKLFLFFSVITLLFSSLVDCFLFNLGPGVIYGILLVAIEKGENDTDVLFSRKRVK